QNDAHGCPPCKSIGCRTNTGAGPLWREFLRRSRDVGTACKQPADFHSMKKLTMPHAHIPYDMPHFSLTSSFKNDVRIKEVRP
ncbi:hypothetical protein, partial [Rhizobium sp. SEMIA 4085]|uniref:hypothetical protein n=1 Tax=Rhizobium sp. SEMIA 4085 TaxID=2137761 RepID=UPI001AEE393A